MERFCILKFILFFSVRKGKNMRRYENVKIEKLIPYRNNARTHSDEQVEKIAKSMREFGFINPVLVDGKFNIIAGHGRVLGAKKLGMKEVPCLFIEDLTEEQKRAYIIADNRLAEDAGWDKEMLKIELEELQNLNFDISLTGFEMEDFDFGMDETEVVEDEFDETVPEEPKSKKGEIYKLGKHYLMCGDSTDINDVEKLLNGAKVDLFLTDPPYNVDYQGGTGLTIQNDNMDEDAFREFLKVSFFNANTVMKEGAVFYIWHADSEGYNFRGACYDIGWKVRQCLIWCKNTLVMGRQDYHWKHEPCLYGWKEGASHLWASDRRQTTVLEFDRPSVSKEHPTMKPVGLFDYLIKNNTKKDDIVLDLFAGSGTTIIACEQNGRVAYSMELDPRYVDVIIARWEKLTGEQAERIEVENEQ